MTHELGKVEQQQVFNLYGGCDTRVLVNGETLGSAQSISLYYNPKTCKLAGRLIVLIMNEGITKLGNRLHESTVKVITANEYGSQLDIVPPGLMEVESVVSRISVDDLVLEAIVSFTIQY